MVDYISYTHEESAKTIKRSIWQPRRTSITLGYCIGGNSGSGRSSGKNGCSSGLLYLPTYIKNISTFYYLPSDNQLFLFKNSKWTHLHMDLFSFSNHIINQRSFKTIHVEKSAIICISIVTILGSLQQAKYDAVFQSNQSLSDATQCQFFTLINPPFPKKSAPFIKRMLSSFSITKTGLRKRKTIIQDKIRV